jgi:hypothetical protein
MKSVEKFWDEVQNVLAPGFSSFGRNLHAFRDILRGGFRAFEEGEQIRLKFIHRNYARKHIPDGFIRKIVRIIEESPNVELVE